MFRLARITALLALVAALVIVAVPRPAIAQANAVVRAVFFFSPTCGHCHIVSTEVLPPLREQYGRQLEILELDVSTAEGNGIWQAAVNLYKPSVVGVPFMIVGEQSMIGSVEIPTLLPGLIERGLAEGGVDWPALPGIEDAVAKLGVGDPSAPAGFLASAMERYTRDPVGNTLSIAVLMGLVVGLVAVSKARPWQISLSRRLGPVAMLLAIAVGLIAAIYLSYVETTGTEAVCGPVGDCNAVQQSEYAILFGFLPVAVLGVAGYLVILAAYIYGTWIENPRTRYGHLLTFGAALFGLIFFIRLTFLEPFVIGATCAWCLTAAVSMLCITLLSAGQGWEALRWLAGRLGLRTKPRRRY